MWVLSLYFIDHPLVSDWCAFQPKWHYTELVMTKWSQKCSFLDRTTCHLDLPVSFSAVYYREELGSPEDFQYLLNARHGIGVEFSYSIYLPIVNAKPPFAVLFFTRTTGDDHSLCEGSTTPSCNIFSLLASALPSETVAHDTVELKWDDAFQCVFRVLHL